MMRKQFLVLPLTAALLTIGGCVTVPTGPSVMVLPSQQKPFEVFRAEDNECRNYAYNAMGGPAGAQASANSAAGSAVAGTLLGAAAGAAIGSVSHNAGAGAAIGAGTGLLFGSAAGANSAGASYAYTQRAYDNAYVQCMYARGNQVANQQSYGPPPRYYRPAPAYGYAPAPYGPPPAYAGPPPDYVPPAEYGAPPPAR